MKKEDIETIQLYIVPWMNSDILESIRYRDETLNKLRKSKMFNPDLYKEYFKLRNIVQRDIRI